MFEKDAEKHCNEVLCSVCENVTCTELLQCREWRDRRAGFYCGAEFGYNKANEEHKEKCKTAYIKGIRTMANALKDYDRTNGIWTDYFEHTVEEVLNRLLKESK